MRDIGREIQTVQEIPNITKSHWIYEDVEIVAEAINNDERIQHISKKLTSVGSDKAVYNKMREISRDIRTVQGIPKHWPIT